MKFFKPAFFRKATEDILIKKHALEPSEIWAIEGAVAEIANRILTECGVRVYGVPEYHDDWASNKDTRHTVQAFVVCIEELPKKECEHAPHLSSANSVAWINYDNVNKVDVEPYVLCYKCGIKLKARWELA